MFSKTGTNYLVLFKKVCIAFSQVSLKSSGQRDLNHLCPMIYIPSYHWFWHMRLLGDLQCVLIARWIVLCPVVSSESSHHALRCWGDSNSHFKNDRLPLLNCSDINDPRSRGSTPSTLRYVKALRGSLALQSKGQQILSVLLCGSFALVCLSVQWVEVRPS